MLTKKLEILEKEMDSERSNNGFTDLYRNMITQRNDLEFQRNKQCIHFPLRGKNKHHFAYSCYRFSQSFPKVNDKRRSNRLTAYNDDVEIFFQKHAIVLKYKSNGAETHLKTFDTKEEMLGFVHGWNMRDIGW